MKLKIKIFPFPESGMKPFSASASYKIRHFYCKEFYSLLPPFAILSNWIFILFFPTVFNASNAEIEYNRSENRKRTERKK
uniref:Uncharacterized protein n=1 Tax=Archaeoglobus fulgidus TaxID=2234 RepID=A0A7J2TI25_ARCFL